MKYPEFREQFKYAQWFGGHLCLASDGRYYKLVRVDGQKEKELRSFTYDELDAKAKDLIKEESKKGDEAFERLKLFLTELQPARQKLIDYVRANGRMVDMSDVSESEYWSVVSPVNGERYNVRISQHIHPTGSMTNFSTGNIIDTTDYDLRRFLKLFNL